MCPPEHPSAARPYEHLIEELVALQHRNSPTAASGTDLELESTRYRNDENRRYASVLAGAANMLVVAVRGCCAGPCSEAYGACRPATETLIVQVLVSSLAFDRQADRFDLIGPRWAVGRTWFHRSVVPLPLSHGTWDRRGSRSL